MFSQLIRPFGYLIIKHPSRLPQWVNWGIPVLVSLALVCVVYKVGLEVDVFGASGVLNRLLGFIQSLPGFYIAALAAIATFDNEDMKKLMPGTPPTMNVVHHGKTVVTVQLTRRRFLSSMFAFLTTSSIFLTLLSITALSVVESVKAMLPPSYIPVFKAGFSLVYFVFVVQLISVTMWGLFYLGERVHTPD